jgi:hypothetical protein
MSYQMIIIILFIIFIKYMFSSNNTKVQVELVDNELYVPKTNIRRRQRAGST